MLFPKAKTGYLTTLDGRGAAAEEVGGKGASLDRLVASGIPIPPAVAITVDAYRAFVDRSGLSDKLRDLPRARPEGLQSDTARVEEAFLKAEMPHEIRDAIWRAWEYAAQGKSVAVRSSATAEDLAEASFAGQYASFLEVDRDGLERAVRLVWSSLWHPAGRAYRDALSIESGDIAMAVIVQRLVPAEWSGVVFTVDPTGSHPDALRVEAVEGLGDRLVSGQVTPRVWHLRRSDLSSIEEAPLPFLADLGRRALEIEAAFGAAQDVEWSFAAGRTHILQARPITTALGDAFDSVPAPGATYTSAGVGEMLPGVLPPLLWTVNSPLLEDAFAHLYESLGILPGGPEQPMLGRFRGRAALNLSRLKDAARRMPGGSGAEVERQYLGQVFSEEDESPPRAIDRLRSVKPALRALRLRKRLPRDAEIFLSAADLALSLDPDFERLDTSSLVAYRRRVRDLARFGVRTEVAVAASAAANYRGLEIALERWLGTEEASLAAQRLTAGRVREQAGGCEAVMALWDVHCDYCQLPDVARAVYEGPVEETDKRLRGLGEAGVRFLRVVDEGLRRAGSASLYAGPSWDEDRASFWGALRRCRGLEPQEGPPAWMAAASVGARGLLEELERKITRTWRWRTTRVLTGQIVDVRRRLLRRMVADAATFLRLREAVKSAVLRTGGEERRVVRELASRLVAAGALERAGDVLFCSDDELDALALGSQGPGAQTISRRRGAFEALRDGPALPELFSGIPALPPEPEVDLTGNLLRGWATSPGRVTGRARVVRELADARDLERGEVLVGRSTDPSWTPLFLAAGGIVMEEGGPLSHAAIVAREFGLPAVLAAKGATKRITTGMTVVVDGTRGTVEIVEDPEMEEVA